MDIRAVGGVTQVDYAALSQIKATRANTTSSDSEANTAASTAAPKIGGTPPPGGGGGAKPAGGAPPSGGASQKSSTKESSSSSTSPTYDPRDTNQDGIVSPQELAAYVISHPGAAEDNTSTTTTPTNSQVQAGLNAYQQSQQGNSTTGSFLFAV
jgi:hypothetical protein